MQEVAFVGMLSFKMKRSKRVMKRGDHREEERKKLEKKKDKEKKTEEQN